ncbi:hypothetical protein ACFYOV_17730 [Streptomyces sp. NPDC005931]|uniref:hypothetical protein n=1 Tax=Streptomyces sp. NPDC005931 TaxID=3364737 RepID=UPI00369BB3D8
MAELHQSVTLSVVCGSWILGAFPVLTVLLLLDGTDDRAVAAVCSSGVAVLLAGMVGLIGAVILSAGAAERAQDTDRAGTTYSPGDVEVPDFGDGGD